MPYNNRNKGSQMRGSSPRRGRKRANRNQRPNRTNQRPSPRPTRNPRRNRNGAGNQQNNTHSHPFSPEVQSHWGAHPGGTTQGTRGYSHTHNGVGNGRPVRRGKTTRAGGRPGPQRSAKVVNTTRGKNRGRSVRSRQTGAQGQMRSPVSRYTTLDGTSYAGQVIEVNGIPYTTKTGTLEGSSQELKPIKPIKP